MRPVEVSTRVLLTSQPYPRLTDPGLSAVCVKARKSERGYMYYTFQIEGKQHWRVLSQFEIDKQVIRVVSEPLAGKLAA